MIKRTGKSIGVMAAIVIILCSGLGVLANDGSMRGLVSGVITGVLLAAATAVVLLFRTFDGRTPESRDSAATLNADSIERQIFIGSSSRAFVDSIGLTALFAALAVIGQDAFVAWPAIVFLFVIMVLDFAIRFALAWRISVRA